MQPGERDKKGSICYLPGPYADILQRKDGVWIVRERGKKDSLKLTTIDALGLYNVINGTNYDKLPKLPIPKMGAPQVVKSESRAGVTYTISQDDTGRLWCTCPGFGYRRTCKHVETMEQLLKGDPPEAKDLEFPI